MNPKEKEAKRKRISRNNRKRAGICIDCTLPAIKDKTKCAKHLTIAKNRTFRCQEKYLLNGGCRACGKPLVKTYFCEKHLKMAADGKYKRRGKFGLRRFELEAKQQKSILARTKNELGKNWTPETEEFIKDNWRLFFDPLDSILVKAYQYGENERSSFNVDSVSSQDWLDNL